MNSNYHQRVSRYSDIGLSEKANGLHSEIMFGKSSQQEQSDPKKKQVQVLKPIINYNHHQQSKAQGISMTKEEYSFYKPILVHSQSPQNHASPSQALLSKLPDSSKTPAIVQDLVASQTSSSSSTTTFKKVSLEKKIIELQAKQVNGRSKPQNENLMSTSQSGANTNANQKCMPPKQLQTKALNYNDSQLKNLDNSSVAGAGFSSPRFNQVISQKQQNSQALGSPQQNSQPITTRIKYSDHSQNQNHTSKDDQSQRKKTICIENKENYNSFKESFYSPGQKKKMLERKAEQDTSNQRGENSKRLSFQMNKTDHRLSLEPPKIQNFVNDKSAQQKEPTSRLSLVSNNNQENQILKSNKPFQKTSSGSKPFTDISQSFSNNFGKRTMNSQESSTLKSFEKSGQISQLHNSNSTQEVSQQLLLSQISQKNLKINNSLAQVLIKINPQIVKKQVNLDCEDFKYDQSTQDPSSVLGNLTSRNERLQMNMKLLNTEQQQSNTTTKNSVDAKTNQSSSNEGVKKIKLSNNLKLSANQTNNEKKQSSFSVGQQQPENHKESLMTMKSSRNLISKNDLKSINLGKEGSASLQKSTTNAQSLSTSSTMKSFLNGQVTSAGGVSQGMNQSLRKLQLTSKNNSIAFIPGEFAANQQNTIQKNILHQEKQLISISDKIRNRQAFELNLKEIDKEMTDLQMKIASTQNYSHLSSLLKLHSRVQFISYAFVKALQEDLTGERTNNDGTVNSVILNAIEYLRKNLKCFIELMEYTGQEPMQSSRKENNSGIIGSGNKENSQNSSNKNESKSDKRMFVKQNIQISIAFLKKICRLSKQNQERFKDFNQLLNQIEGGIKIQNVKIQVMKILGQLHQQSQQSQLETQTTHNSQAITTTTTLSQTSSKSFMMTASQTSLSQKFNTSVPQKKNLAKHESFKNSENLNQFNTIRQMDPKSNTTTTPLTKSIIIKEVNLEEEGNEKSIKAKASMDKNLNSSGQIQEQIFKNQQDPIKKEYRKERMVVKLKAKDQRSNLNRENGRFSLQPRPIDFKFDNAKLQDDQKENQQDNQQDKNLTQTLPTEGNANKFKLSIFTKKSTSKLTYTHAPITVRGVKDRDMPFKLQFNEQQNLQECEVPANFNPRSNSLPSKDYYLPKESAKGMEYTLVLDLDETLVHFDNRIRNYRPRPGALKFLNEMSKYYELVLFTAGLKDYADFIMNDFDRQRYVSHRLYRDHTKYRNGVYVKDLSKLGRDLSKIIIIDNIEDNFEAQPDNGIPIKSWYNDPNDKELEKMTPFLKNLVINQVPDVRPELRKFKSQQTLIHQAVSSKKTSGSIVKSLSQNNQVSQSTQPAKQIINKIEKQ